MGYVLGLLQPIFEAYGRKENRSHQTGRSYVHCVRCIDCCSQSSKPMERGADQIDLWYRAIEFHGLLYSIFFSIGKWWLKQVPPLSLFVFSEALIYLSYSAMVEIGAQCRFCPDVLRMAT